MFRRLVPRHQAKVAATTWTRKTAAATARQKRRRNASGRVNRSPRTNPKENPSRCTEPVGGTDAGWLAEEVENLSPSIVAPGNRRSPTIRPITKLTKKCPADSGLLVQGTEVPEHRNVTPVLGMVPCVFLGGGGELAGALAWRKADIFRMNLTGSKNNRTYAVTT